MDLLSIVWQASPEIISLGFLKLRWYGFLFAVGYISGYYIMSWLYKKEKIDVKEVENIFIYTAIGGIIGARLGHILFYDIGLYIENPLEILYIWHGGLASHGGAIGILLVMVHYCRKKKYQSYLWIIDRMVIPISLAGMFIRIGNFFNSEIIGKPTDLPWGVIFDNNIFYSRVPRHPSQLYEALAYLGIFIFLMKYYLKNFGKIKEGSILGLFLVLIFSARFILEFTKENQVDFEYGMFMNMGQLLSIPLILLGLWLIFRKENANKNKEKD